jgi:hypothetical protein
MLALAIMFFCSAASMFGAARRNLPAFSTNTLAANDDLSTGLVPISFPINFFGTQYTQLYVNNNGNLTFTAPLGTFTPSPIVANATPMIAAFWADVDTEGPGSGVVHYGSGVGIVDGHNAFGVEWPLVGYFSSKVNKLNSFELILIDRSDTGTGNFDIEFNYDQIQWETGDVSGGTNGLGGSSVRVGYTNGSSAAFELPGSGVPGSLIDGGPNALVTHSLNSSVPGRYVFQARGGSFGPPTVPAPSTLVLVIIGFILVGAWRLSRRGQTA